MPDAPPSPAPCRLVITDIDGTLLDDAGNLPELNRQALTHCRDLGVYTCLATGRRWTTCRRLLDRLDLGPLIDFCILNNGMIVRDMAAGANVARREFPFSLALQAIACLNAHGLDPILLGHNPDGATPDVFFRHDALFNSDFVSKNPGFSVQVADWREVENAHLVELVLIGAQADLDAAAASLAGLEVEIAIIRNTFYREYMLEVTPKGVSKLQGAQDLLAHLRLDIGQILAVGDSENDFPLLKHAPLSIAVANADPRIKAVVKELTGSNGEGGFGQAVFRHLPPAGLNGTGGKAARIGG